MYIDKRVIYIVLAILIFMGLGSFFNGDESLLGLLISMPAILIAITFHEFAHAFVADKLGDDTARRQGRLSLNPLSHLDPIGTVLLVFAGFGWGKPVEINPRNFDRRFSMNVAEAIVAAAGPIMNMILAVIFALIYVAVRKICTKHSL